MAPSIREVLGEVRAPAAPRRAAVLATSILLFLAGAAALAVWSSSAHAQSDSSSSLHAGAVAMNGPVEKQLFQRLLCLCGGCQRLPLSSCACSWAEDMRAKIRDKLAAGDSPQVIQDDYRAVNGAQAIAIPSDRGMDRALWLVPVSLIAVAGGLLLWRGNKWVFKGPKVAGATGLAHAAPDGYDAALDAELRRLDD
jgi:cytochrome c-type biogenesis protein CcmH/NrfF